MRNEASLKSFCRTKGQLEKISTFHVIHEEGIKSQALHGTNSTATKNELKRTFIKLCAIGAGEKRILATERKISQQTISQKFQTKKSNWIK